MIRVRTCRSSDAPVLVAALNECLYKDYKFRVVMTPKRFMEDGRAHDVDLSSTFVALEGSRPVGIALVARRGKRAWVAGMGVLPSHRGQGLGSELLGRAQERVTTLGVRTFLLEVLKENSQARRCYERAGFVAHRRYSCFRGSASTAGHGGSSVDIRTAKPYPLIDEYESLHRVEQCWQRDLVTLRNRASKLRGLVAVVGDEVVGSLLHGDSAISDVGHKVGRSTLPEILPRLLEAAYGMRPFAIVNVPEDDPLHLAMSQAGFEIYAEQLDMRCAV